MLFFNLRNRRKHHRYKTDTRCICYAEDYNEEIPCYIHDVSDKGVCFLFDTQVEGIMSIGSRLDFQFVADTLPKKDAVIGAKGIVANIRRTGEYIMVGCNVPDQKDFNEFARMLKMKNFKEYLQSEEK